MIPVLVDGARMPLRAALPAEIEAFADRNALVLTHERFDEDFDRLLAAIGGGGAATRRYAAVAGVLVLVAGGAAVAWLMPRDSAPFDLLVRVAGADSAAAVHGFVSMDSGRATRRAQMNAQGEAMFVDVPGTFADSTIAITAVAPGYDTVFARTAIPANRVIQLSLVRRQWTTTLRGRVIDRAGRPMAGVLLEFEVSAGTVTTPPEAAARASSDSLGLFAVTLPVPPGDVVRLRASRNDTIGYNDTVLVPEREPLAIRFIPGG